MSRDDFDEHSYQDGGTSTVTPEDSHKQFEKAQQKNLNTLSSFKLEADETGKASLLGVEVDKSMLGPAQMFLDYGKRLLLGQGDKLYKGTAHVATKWLGLKGSAGTVAAAVDTTARWTVIFLEQIVQAYSSSNKYGKKRKEIYQMFEPISQATGANKSNNEVIALAYKRAGEEYSSDLKYMLTDIPRTLPLFLVGLKKQRIANEQYKEWKEDLTFSSSDPLDDAKRRSDKMLERLEAAHKENEKLEEFLDAKRKAYIEQKLKAYGPSPSYEIRREIAHTFDSTQGKAYRDSFLSKGDGSHIGDGTAPDGIFDPYSTGGSLVSQFIKAKLGDRRDRGRQIHHVPEMLDHLIKDMKSQCATSKRGSKDEYGRCEIDGQSAEDIRISGIGGHGEEKSLRLYIEGMFQQHERDRAARPEDYYKKDSKGNVIGLINPLGDPLVRKLQPAIDMISDAIAGGLAPEALVDLIGGNEIIIHGSKGEKTFASEDQIKKAIDKLKGPLSVREVVKLEEFLSKFEKPEAIKTSIKESLKAYKGKQKAVYASLYPDDILEQLGMGKKEITAARKDSHEDLYNFVAANVLKLSKMGDETLEKMGGSKQDIGIVTDLAESLKSGDIKKLTAAVDGRDKSLIDAVRTLGLLVQNSGKENANYFTERMSEINSVVQQMAANKLKRDQNEHGDEAPRSGKKDDAESEKKWSADKRSSRRGSDSEERPYEDSRKSGSSDSKWADERIEKRERTSPSKKWDSDEPSRSGYASRVDDDGDDRGTVSERALKKRDKSKDDSLAPKAF